jgi:hypothetical protein
MASGSPKHHVDRLGHRLGDRSDNPALAPEERIGTLVQITDAGRKILPSNRRNTRSTLRAAAQHNKAIALRRTAQGATSIPDLSFAGSPVPHCEDDFQS